MSKSRIAVLTLVTAFSLISLLQFRTIARLRRELVEATHENNSLPQNIPAQEQDSSPSGLRVTSDAGEQMGQPQQKRLVELESEVMRLRGAAGRAIRAEAEVAQLRSAVQSHQVSAVPGAPDANSTSNLLYIYLGEAVPPPANIDPAYTKDGLMNALQQAAQLADVPLKKVEIDTSEFPFLLGAVCDSDADFEKIKEQFKNMTAYKYGGSTSSHGTYAFNITPYGSYPSEAQRIGRRVPLRMQMLFNQLNTP
jgi:hypothetical protein